MQLNAFCYAQLGQMGCAPPSSRTISVISFSSERATAGGPLVIAPLLRLEKMRVDA
jgi:hypothetical protein